MSTFLPNSFTEVIVGLYWEGRVRVVEDNACVQSWVVFSFHRFLTFLSPGARVKAKFND